MAHDPLLAGEVERLRRRLEHDGWCILPNALPTATLMALDADLASAFADTPFCQGGFYGETTKRFSRLLARSGHMAGLVQQEIILGVAEALLAPWCDCIQLNVAQAIAIYPGAPAQLPHRDEDMWAGAKGEIEYLLNVIWPLTPFHAGNGATRLWSGSHRDKRSDAGDVGEGVAAEMRPGDALLFLGSTLHGAGANRSTEVRRGVVVGYSLGWLKPYENPFLAYPPPVARHFAPELAALVGYRQHRPNLGNFEGQCPSMLLEAAAIGPLAATDALRPDQVDAVLAHRAAQLGSA